MNKEQPDKRYRLFVNLEREDRPKYFEYRCQFDGTVVCEINNAKVVSVTDMSDMQNIDNVFVGVRCTGQWQGHHCGTWYYHRLIK